MLPIAPPRLVHKTGYRADDRIGIASARKQAPGWRGPRERHAGALIRNVQSVPGRMSVCCDEVDSAFGLPPRERPGPKSGGGAPRDAVQRVSTGAERNA